MIEEGSLLLNLNGLKVLFPLSLKELKNLKLDLLGSLFLQMPQASQALVEDGIIDLPCEDKTISWLRAVHL